MTDPTKPMDQWIETETPHIVEDGSAFARYRVESASQPGLWNLVDLTDRGGLGSCSCVDFQTRANPNYKRHGKHIPWAPNREGRSDCKHLAQAKECFYQNVTVPMLASFANGIPTNQPS